MKIRNWFRKEEKDDSIKYWLVRTGILRDLRDSPNTLRMLAKHLELEMGNEDPVEYLQFVIDQSIAETMEEDAKHTLERAGEMRLHGPA